MIAHVDMDAFFASIEAHDRPELQGQPIIVGVGRRGVVSAASYQARAFGVRSAMPIFQAKKLCPHGVFLPVRKDRYQEVSHQVMEVLRSFSPVVEPVSVDEAFIDLAGTQGLWGAPFETGTAIKKEMLKKTGLVASVGIAPVRFLAKIASDRDKPDGLTIVTDVEEFLTTVKLKDVSGVGKKAQARLGELGLTMLTQVRALGRKRLTRILGVNGQRLWELSYGIDPTGVNCQRNVKSISHELTLNEDSDDPVFLGSLLLAMASKVARRLRAQELVGNTVVLKLKHSDHRLVTRSKSLFQATDLAEEIFQVSKKMLDDYPSWGPFRLIGVGVSNLLPRSKAQASLLDRQNRIKRQAIAKAEDQVLARFGAASLKRAGELNIPGPKDRKSENK